MSMRRGAAGIPLTGLTSKIIEVDGAMTDVIGLSISELYPLVDPLLQSIISADGGVTKRADADIVALALASPYLNLLTMIGSAEKGIVFYAVGTARAVLDKALSWFKLPALITGSASRDATRVSTYVGNSLLEIVGLDLSQFVGRKIAITSNSITSIGFIGAAGGGETLDANIFATLDLTTGWTTSNATINDANTFTPSASLGYVQKSSGTLRKLYKYTYVASSTYLRDSGSLSTAVYTPSTGVYRTCMSATLRILGSTSGVPVDITTLSMQEVIDVAVTGAKIFQQAALTSQRWAVDAITDHNHSGGITFVVYP